MFLSIRSRLISWTGCMALVFALGPSPVHAGICFDTYLTTTNARGVTLVGVDEYGHADPTAEFIVTVYGLGTGQPLPDAEVTLKFWSHSPNHRICQSQPDVTFVGCSEVDFEGGVVSQVTDASGRAVFRIVGGGSGSSASDNQYVTVFICGEEWRTFTKVATLDLDGNDGVGPADLSIVVSDMFDGSFHSRSDYDYDLVNGPNDLSLWLDAFYGGHSVNSCSSACP